MKERPIIFSTPMVRAILEGRKTQTRRLAVKTSRPDVVVPVDFDSDACLLEIENRHSGNRYWKPCEYGQPGERLWVRETFCDATGALENRVLYRADGDVACRWSPSIHMPRRASRITLQITSIRVERLQDISPDDCIAEGAWLAENRELGRGHEAVDAFRTIWESIHGQGSWAANPWLWVIEFKRMEGGAA